MRPTLGLKYAFMSKWFVGKIGWGLTAVWATAYYGRLINSSINSLINSLINQSINQPSKSVNITVVVPRRADVGSGPTEQIKRTMTDMTNARIPAGFGTAIASAADSSITAHISPDT